MKENIKDYIAHFKNILSNDLCDSMIEEIKNLNWHQHTFYDIKTKKELNRSGEYELDVLYNNFESENTKKIMSFIWTSIYNYVKNYSNIHFSSWTGHSPVRFNRYEKNKKMASHCDHIQSLFDGERKGIPILSVLGLLNDNFEGGDFVFFDDHKMKFNKGDIIVFPSIFLYPHRVEPVTKGTRYSYISWVW